MTVVEGVLKGSEKLAFFDLKGIDGAVNAVRHSTVGLSFFSGFFDLRFVDGIVNLSANLLGWGGNLWRKIQTGVVQHYAFILTFGIFSLITIYLIFF
jgi:NADH-quinone oxidoreductase subunit L